MLAVASQSGLMFSYSAIPPADDFFISRNKPKIVVGALTELNHFPKQVKLSTGVDYLADFVRMSSC